MKRLIVVSEKSEVITASIPEFRIDQTPDVDRWMFFPIYKISATGGLLLWQIGFDGINQLIMRHGYADGVVREDRTEVSLNTSGRSMAEQSLLEARRRYQDKYMEGYQPAGDINPPMIKGMKGNKYEEGKIKNWPVGTQPKLDGIRLLCRLEAGNKVHCRTWLNRTYTHLTLLEKELSELFTYLPRNATVDGELYIHGMDFNDLTSIVKSTKNISSRINEIEYWMFDIDYNDHQCQPTFNVRYELLVNAFVAMLKGRSPNGDASHPDAYPKLLRVVQYELCYDSQELLKQHNKHVEDGYEGIMIKKLPNDFPPESKEYKSSLYKPGKSNNILKYKNFIDEEAIVKDVVRPKGSEKDAALLKIQDKRGNIFNARPKGSFHQRSLWLKNPELVIGKEVTIRYQNLSQDGVPRFPVAVAIRDYEN